MKVGDLVRYVDESILSSRRLRGQIGIVESWYCLSRGYVFVCWPHLSCSPIPIQKKHLEVINENG